MKKTFLIILVTALITSLSSVFFVNVFNEKEEVGIIEKNKVDITPPIYATAFSQEGEPVNFSVAAEKTVNSVVHVKTIFEQELKGRSNDPIWEFFYGYRNPNPRPAMGSGSGVIISPDGYIVTNNHVIDNAREVKVTFNDKKTLVAKIIGADKSTDIALLKVNATDLPTLSFGDSDHLRLGEWVLAVGNPFNLTSTVTAGIVSAKARDINVINSEFKIESFIQTDAAINPGNSGGALVNLNGDLVGINTAIASRSGQYEGYAFAVPSSIVKKVVEDLIQYGKVQRAVLGIRYREVDEELVESLDLKDIKGAFIMDVEDNSAAKEAGLQKGDILLKINDKDIINRAVIQEQVGKSRPGDKMELLINRDGKMKQITVVLRNKKENFDLNNINADIITRLGATYKDVSVNLRRALGIYGGVQVDKLSNGLLKKEGIKEGFIITHVNQRFIRSVSDLNKVLENIDESSGILILGIYPNGRKAHIVIY